MSNNYFSFKQFTIFQDKAAFKVGTDGVLLGACADVKEVKSILDIGTGTGLIAIMLAQRCEAQIIALEPDGDSFEQCVENISHCRWADRISAENLKLQEYFPEVLFDLIVTNPPFFTDSLRNPDPGRAATRHNDTLNNRDLLGGVSRLLAENGRLQIILPYVEGNLFIAEAQEYGLFCNDIIKIRPLPSSEVRRMVLTFSRRQLKPRERFLTIEHGRRHEFTEDYISLTRDFYLKF